MWGMGILVTERARAAVEEGVWEEVSREAVARAE